MAYAMRSIGQLSFYSFLLRRRILTLVEDDVVKVPFAAGGSRAEF
jgi:hypothetical protein